MTHKEEEQTMIDMYISEFKRMEKNEKLAIHIKPDESIEIRAGVLKYLNLGRYDKVQNLYIDDDTLHLVMFSETETKDGEDE